MSLSKFLVLCGEATIVLPEGKIEVKYGWVWSGLTVSVFWIFQDGSIGGTFIPVIQKPEETVEMAVKRHLSNPFPSGIPLPIRNAFACIGGLQVSMKTAGNLPLFRKILIYSEQRALPVATFSLISFFLHLSY